MSMVVRMKACAQVPFKCVREGVTGTWTCRLFNMPDERLCSHFYDLATFVHDSVQL